MKVSNINKIEEFVKQSKKIVTCPYCFAQYDLQDNEHICPYCGHVYTHNANYDS